MHVEQYRWTPERGWAMPADRSAAPADLVLVFGDRKRLEDARIVHDLRRAFPGAETVGCSTAGEIHGTQVSEGSVVASVIRFADTKVRTAELLANVGDDGRLLGAHLARMLPPEGLAHVLVLSDGQRVNGSELARGLREALPGNVAVTGGLAGDGTDFKRTLVFARGDPEEGRVAVVGFYGSRFRVGYGSLGGWDPFGPQRLVTRAKGNTLYELDGQPALPLYKRYLGQHADGLPATGLLFPLSIQTPGVGHELVRTILAVDETEQSLTFAGDMPEGSLARLMKANFDRLIDGAQGAAQSSLKAHAGATSLGLLISCVGRRLVLRQRTEQELEAVRDVLGPQAALTGFYSYGEICPAAPNASCELHNQTMTITSFAEAEA